MLPLNIWDAWDILRTAVLQSITRAVVDKVLCSLLNPLGMISPGGLCASRRYPANANAVAHHHLTFSGCVHSPASLLPLSRLQTCLGAQTGQSVDYIA